MKNFETLNSKHFGPIPIKPLQVTKKQNRAPGKITENCIRMMLARIRKCFSVGASVKVQLSNQYIG